MAKDSGTSILCTKKKKRRKVTQLKWSNLPSDLLKLILNNLASANDIPNFKSVCSSWNDAAKSKPRPPLLMVPSGYEGRNSCCFYSLVTRKILHTAKNMFEGISSPWCVGSLNRWLVILDQQAVPRLSNPITGVQIELPNIQPDLVGSRKCFKSLYRFQNKKKPFKTVISSDPSRNKYFAVVIFARELNRIAFWKHGNRTWTCLEDGKSNCAYHDITFDNPNQLSALALDGSVTVWDFDVKSYLKKTKLHPEPLTDCRGISWISWLHTYLVHSSDELLRVERLLAEDWPEGKYQAYTRWRFRVSRMNMSAKKWVKVDTLNERSLILGANQSISLSTREFPELEENSIYYMNVNSCSRYSNFRGWRSASLDIGKYELGHGGKYMRKLWVERLPFFELQISPHFWFCY